eukprot:scaffold32315_cov129-Skeletonema_marinoi.AAC.1
MLRAEAEVMKGGAYASNQTAGADVSSYIHTSVCLQVRLLEWNFTRKAISLCRFGCHAAPSLPIRLKHQ